MKFSGLHLSKNYIPSTKILFTDLSNITFNWLVVWKMTWGIWQIFTRALESLKIEVLVGSFNPKLKIMSLKYTEELSVMTLKNDANFEEELACHFKVDMRNFTNFDASTWSLKNFHFNVLLLSKVYIIWAKKVQRSFLSWN